MKSNIYHFDDNNDIINTMESERRNILSINKSKNEMITIDPVHSKASSFKKDISEDIDNVAINNNTNKSGNVSKKFFEGNIVTKTINRHKPDIDENARDKNNNSLNSNKTFESTSIKNEIVKQNHKINSNQDLFIMKKDPKLLWSKAKNIVKGLLAFRKMSQNINLYGIVNENDNDMDYIKIFKKMKTQRNLFSLEENPVLNKNEDVLENKVKNNYKCDCKSTFLERIFDFLLFEETHIFIVIWNSILSFMLIYVVIITPYYISFISNDSILLSRLEEIINIIFIIDILMTFNISYKVDGKFEKNRWNIFINYLKGWLFIDVVTCIPFEYFFDNSINTSTNGIKSNKILRVLKITKIYRILRFLKMLRFSRLFKKLKFLSSFQDFLNINYGISKMIGFLFIFVITLHIYACLFYYVAILYNENNNWIVKKNLLDDSNFRKYLHSIYFTVTTIFTVGFGDITPGNEIEYLMTIVLIIFGIGFYSFSIGTITTILVNINNIKNAKLKNYSIIHKYCDQCNLDETLRNDLLRHIKYSSDKNIINWINRQDFFSNLPGNLKMEVRYYYHI